MVLDHRVGEQLVGELGEQPARLLRARGVELDLEQLALPHRADGGVAEARAGLPDRLALRVEHVGLERHVHERLHGVLLASARSKIASTWRSAWPRSKARSISSLLSTSAIAGSASTRSR